ncbi:MAG: UDP-N-acetylmuramoyl-L-alanine--D-glutamate ligase [Verrucomicrobia bacterium]|nr:MAG: UDP-N-acetylmuramoyl-L-alanine--D-glutamate ligase [Verrucomicrobiota bacterium]
MKPSIPDWLQHLLDKPVAIFGGGVSGRAAASLVAALGGEAVIYDREADVPARREFTATAAGRHGLAVFSPGFALTHPWIRCARSAGCEVLGELDFAALAWPGRILAVTGTNGKTTICQLLGHGLREAGLDVRVAGNIGRAFSEVVTAEPGRAETIAVCEVSSFQAESLRFFEADWSLWSNYAEDHLERHGSPEAYFRAKLNLLHRTRERRLLYGPAVRDAAAAFGFELPVEGAVDFGPRPELRDALAGTVFAEAPQRENFLLARALWQAMGLEPDTLLAAARSFRLAAHRLQPVDEVAGVTFWNDSKATNFHAAEAALRRFSRPVLWILGGRSKGGDIAGFIRRSAPHVRHAFVLGETADELERLLRAEAVPVIRCNTLREATERAFSRAVRGDNVVLSPGFASFDLFKSYEDRGRQFEAAVAQLAANHRAAGDGARTHNSNRPAPMGACTPL